MFITHCNPRCASLHEKIKLYFANNSFQALARNKHLIFLKLIYIGLQKYNWVVEVKPKALKLSKYLMTYRVFHETWQLVNSFECLLPYTLIDIKDFLQFNLLKKMFYSNIFHLTSIFLYYDCHGILL